MLWLACYSGGWMAKGAWCRVCIREERKSLKIYFCFSLALHPLLHGFPNIFYLSFCLHFSRIHPSLILWTRIHGNFLNFCFEKCVYFACICVDSLAGYRTRIKIVFLILWSHFSFVFWLLRTLVPSWFLTLCLWPFVFSLKVSRIFF